MVKPDIHKVGITLTIEENELQGKGFEDIFYATVGICQLADVRIDVTDIPLEQPHKFTTESILFPIHRLTRQKHTENVGHTLRHAFRLKSKNHTENAKSMSGAIQMTRSTKFAEDAFDIFITFLCRTHVTGFRHMVNKFYKDGKTFVEHLLFLQSNPPKEVCILKQKEAAFTDVFKNVERGTSVVQRGPLEHIKQPCQTVVGKVGVNLVRQQQARKTSAVPAVGTDKFEKMVFGNGKGILCNSTLHLKQTDDGPPAGNVFYTAFQLLPFEKPVVPVVFQIGMESVVAVLQLNRAAAIKSITALDKKLGCTTFRKIMGYQGFQILLYPDIPVQKFCDNATQCLWQGIDRLYIFFRQRITAALVNDNVILLLFVCSDYTKVNNLFRPFFFFCLFGFHNVYCCLMRLGFIGEWPECWHREISTVVGDVFSKFSL